MAKIEKIGNTQVIDNKEDNFFYFPMISMACTGLWDTTHRQRALSDINGRESGTIAGCTAEILGLIPVYHSAIIKPHTCRTEGKRGCVKIKKRPLFVSLSNKNYTDFTEKE